MEQVMTQSGVAEADMMERTEESLLKYLSFYVDGDTYALDALRVKEIIEFSNVTRIPMVPPYIRGVTNLRGSVVPVLDLAARLGKRITPVTKRTCIVIVELHDEEGKLDLGVVIDSINEVFNISEDDIEPAPSFGAGIRADFISGMGRQNGKFVVLLDTDRVLSIEELSLLRDDTGLSTHYDAVALDATAAGTGKKKQDGEANPAAQSDSD